MKRKRPERQSRSSQRSSSKPRNKKQSSRSRPPRNRPDRGGDETNWTLIGGGIAAALLLFVLMFFGIRALQNGEDEVVTVTAVSATSIPVNNPTDTPNAAPTDIPTTTEPRVTIPSVPTENPDPVFTPPDISSLQQYMQSLINADRLANGQSEIGWDETAALAGMLHAQEMNSFSYLSHWNLSGYGPDYRYTKAGGLNVSSENVYYYEHTPNSVLTPTSAEDWRKLIADAQQSLMDSPGHEANILAPAHTDVGIGIAYDERNGRLRIAQEFTNHYVVIQPIPLQTAVGGEIAIQGRLLSGVTNPLINLAFEPYPSPMGIDELNNTNTYESPSEIYDAIEVVVDENGAFNQTITLNHDQQSGLYHVRLWVDTSFGETLAVNVVVEVR